MDKLTKVYTDSRYKTSDSISNTNSKFELKETLYLPSNTVCHVDEISIPRSWYSIEDFNTNIYTQQVYAGTQISGTILPIPVGNYNTTRLASVIENSLHARYDGYINCPNDELTCTYDN